MSEKNKPDTSKKARRGKTQQGKIELLDALQLERKQRVDELRAAVERVHEGVESHSDKVLIHDALNTLELVIASSSASQVLYGHSNTTPIWVGGAEVPEETGKVGSNHFIW